MTIESDRELGAAVIGYTRKRKLGSCRVALAAVFEKKRERERDKISPPIYELLGTMDEQKGRLADRGYQVKNKP